MTIDELHTEQIRKKQQEIDSLCSKVYRNVFMHNNWVKNGVAINDPFIPDMRDIAIEYARQNGFHGVD